MISRSRPPRSIHRACTPQRVIGPVLVVAGPSGALAIIQRDRDNETLAS